MDSFCIFDGMRPEMTTTWTYGIALWLVGVLFLPLTVCVRVVQAGAALFLPLLSENKRPAISISTIFLTF